MSSDQPDGMGTVQIGYALEAYRRFVAGENTLFDLTQWTPGGAPGAPDRRYQPPGGISGDSGHERSGAVCRCLDRP